VAPEATPQAVRVAPEAVSERLRRRLIRAIEGKATAAALSPAAAGVMAAGVAAAGLQLLPSEWGDGLMAGSDSGSDGGGSGTSDGDEMEGQGHGGHGGRRRRRRRRRAGRAPLATAFKTTNKVIPVTL
jgi:hypothetical protein